jgi:hypothetical protein
MFFDDRVAALHEMRRVRRARGRLVVAVWDALERSPGYAALAVLVERLFGQGVAEPSRAPIVLGEEARLRALCAEAGLPGAGITSHAGMVRFASVDELVSTERACVWTLGGLLDDGQFERLRAEARQVLDPFVDAQGQVAFSMPALLITA